MMRVSEDLRVHSSFDDLNDQRFLDEVTADARGDFWKVLRRPVVWTVRGVLVLFVSRWQWKRHAKPLQLEAIGVERPALGCCYKSKRLDMPPRNVSSRESMPLPVKSKELNVSGRLPRPCSSLQPCAGLNMLSGRLKCRA